MKSLYLFSSAALSAMLAAGQQSSPAPTTISVFLPGADSQNLVASVVSAAPTETIYQICCPEDVDAADCGFLPGATVTHAPPTASGAPVVWGGIMTYTDSSNALTAAWSCQFQGTTSALCAVSSDAEGMKSKSWHTEPIPQEYITFYPVVVTAGQEKLTAAATASASVTGSSASAGMVTSVSGTNASRSGTGSVSGSGSGSSMATRTGGATGATEAANMGARIVVGKVSLVVIAAAAAGAGYALV